MQTKQNQYGGQYSSAGFFGINLTGERRTPPVKSKLSPTRVRGALSPHATDGLEAILARQEREERETEEDRTRAATTAAMERAAGESREREEREWLAAARAEEEASYTAFLSHWFPHVQEMMEVER